MYSHLVITEFIANRVIWLAWLVINIFFFVMTDRSGEDVANDFMAFTLIAFFVLLIISASIGSEEKRIRLYTQLPVTPSQVFFASWFWVLLLLGLQLVTWLLFAYLYDPDFDLNLVLDLSASALSIYFMIVLVALAIDLGAFKPAYVQWTYLGTLALLIALAIRYDLSVGLVGSETGIQVYPLAAITDGRSSIVLIVLLIALLKGADWFVYTRSDHYLR